MSDLQCPGYSLTQYSIRPFSDYDLTNDAAEAKEWKIWNVKLSCLRVAVKNAYGRLKGQFPCLRALRGHKIRDMYRFIESLLIVHNIIEEFGDDPKDISGFNGLEDPWVDEVFHGAPERLNDDDLYCAGLYRRKQLFEYSRAF